MGAINTKSVKIERKKLLLKQKSGNYVVTTSGMKSDVYKTFKPTKKENAKATLKKARAYYKSIKLI